MSDHHHGKVIKVHRLLCGLTQAQLAEKWPKADGERGVSTNYVHLVETGKKQISDPSTLRKLCDILEIPHWKFGLSEYDPFDPRLMPGCGKRMFNETLDVAEALIKQTLTMRRIAPLPDVQRSAQSLDKLFAYFMSNSPPSSQLEPRFLNLYAQILSIRGLMFFENKQYTKALEAFKEMYMTSQKIDDPVLMVHALQKMGVELRRAGRNQEAIDALEEARDRSFKASKHVAAFANAYLAHIYAGCGVTLRFERAIHTSLSLVDSIKTTYGDGT